MHRNLRSLNAILFDLGSTLVYFDGSWPDVLRNGNDALLNSLLSSGLDLDRRSFGAEFQARMQTYWSQRDTEFIEYSTAYILRSLLTEMGYPSVSEGLIRQALSAMYAVSQAHWKPEADAAPTLQALRAAGYCLGIISNAGDDADVQRLVDQGQLRSYFDFVISSAAMGIRKPNPRIFQLALDHWGLAPEQAAMVGDTLGADILGAHNAGLFSIWITRRADVKANRAHLDTIRPHATISALSEIPGLLQALGRETDDAVPASDPT